MSITTILDTEDSKNKYSLKDFLGVDVASAKGLIDIINKGLKVNVFIKLAKALGLSEKELSKAAIIPIRTVSRRKEKKDRFAKDESDRLIRITLLFIQAVELFEGDQEKAAKWFRTPKKALGNISPLDYAETDPGAREVSELIGRLEHGVF